MGAALLLRREALDEIGLFDEEFFLYSEEVDLQLRLRRAGWKVEYFPEVSVVHHESQFSAGIPERRINEMWRSRHRYWRKHHSPAGARIAAVSTGAQYAARAALSPLARADRSVTSRMLLHARDAWRVRGPGLRELADDWNGACGSFAAPLAAPRSCCCRCRSSASRGCFRRRVPACGSGSSRRRSSSSCPGALVSRALRLRGASATVVWSLAALGPALVLVFVVHSSIWLALIVLGVVAVVALPFALRVVSGPPSWSTLAVALAGLGFGILMWHVAGAVTGDALFHLGRVRKLTELGDLHIRSVDEFADGGLHPGYAFPLWHAFLALVSKLAGTDPTQVMVHEPSALAPVAFAVAYESGLALFRSAWVGLAVLAAAVSGAALAPGHGGAFALLSQPGTLDRYILVPAALTLFFLFLRHPGVALGLSLAAAGVEVLLVACEHGRLHRHPAGRVPRCPCRVRAGGCPEGGGGPCRDLSPRRSCARLAAPARRRDRLAFAVRLGVAALAREVRLRAPRRLDPPLCAPPGGRVTRRRGRGRGIGTRAARGLRGPSALGGTRPRRDVGHPRHRIAGLDLPALRRRGVACPRRVAPPVSSRSHLRSPVGLRY